MTLPITIPNTFANATASIPLSQLDNNFSTVVVAVNGIGNGAESLSNVSITGGSVANVTLANVSISGETLDNVTLTNVSITSGNATFTTANVTTVDTTNIEVTNIKAKDGTAAIAIADSTGVTTQSTPAIISVNSASDALRITQVGAGNALLVEDSANPDATPFVIDAAGRTLIGYGVSNTYQAVGRLQVTGSTDAHIAIGRFTDNALSPTVNFNKSRSTDPATRTVLQTNDDVGAVIFAGDDGTNFVQAAVIQARVDGTPGTNDMPGRLVFSTTADGASTPTERMRIDSAGQVGIGTTAITGFGLRLGKNITGATTSYGINQGGVVQSDVTTGAFGIRNAAATAATSFTLPSYIHFSAEQGTFGAGSTVNNQYGFVASSGLTGATNNYGFYSNIASGSGRWNFYANGTAANYMAGTLEVGSTIGVGDATPAASGAGITFPATQSASSDANTLDDYEQGTFTPTAVGGTTAGTTTYVGQVGHYTKIGRQVTVTIYLQYSAMTGTGPLQIGGLPFSTMGSNYQGSFPAMIGGLNWSAGTMIMGYVPTSQSYLLLYGMADDANYTNQTCVNEAAEYYITCTYFAVD
jgi:hypothetical protein